MRFASLLLSAFWIGGLAALGIAAPAAFSVLQVHDPVAGRTLAGELFGVMLAKYQQVLWSAGALHVILLLVRAASGRKPRQLALQLIVLAAMLGVSSYSALVIAPRIDAIRVSTPTPMASLAIDNPVRREFGMLHGMSNGLLALAFAGGISLVWLDRKD